jgi:hypothetical protein
MQPNKKLLQSLKEQLKLTNTKVRKWTTWNPNDSSYEAFYDSRQVIVPVPVCEWSFLVGLHEIGHISTGPRLFAYLSEYNAEQWAIKRAKSAYGIVHEEYVKDAKNYVYNHLLGDLMYSCLELKKVKPHVLEWLETTPKDIIESIKKIINDQNLNIKELSKTIRPLL